jgi:hypothetical protein
MTVGVFYTFGGTAVMAANLRKHAAAAVQARAIAI